MRSVLTAPLRLLVSCLAGTWRLESHGDEQIEQFRGARTPVLYAVWHGQLLAPLWHRREQGITLLVSGHDDAGRLADAARAWGYRVVRGSSTRGAVAGMLGLLRALRSRGLAAVTPDGPRGPAGVVKVGVVAAAQWTGAAIVPVAAAASAAWRLRSWDGFLLPKPFARVRIVYGTPITVAAGSAELRRGVARLLAELRAAGENAQCSF
jgi:lysophospholipid acyltransferase (LPLAT)-like uncharacterized protein